MDVSERSMLMVLSDGVHTLQFMLAHAEEQRITDGSVVKGTIVHLQEFTCNTIKHRRIIFIIKLDILQSECAIIGSPIPYGSMNVPREQGPNVPAAAAQNYAATYSGDPGLRESSVAPRASQVANNQPIAKRKKVANNQGPNVPAIDNVGLPTYVFLFPFTGAKNFEQNVPRLDCFDSSLGTRTTYTYNGHETGSNEDSHEYYRSIFSNWIDSTESSYEYYRYWVIHEEHREVCIQGLRVKNELFRHLTPGEEVCEIAFRAFKRIELQNSMKARVLVRRHFITVDWARYAPVYKPDHELWDDIFSSKWNGYNLAYCQMIISLVEIQKTWSCYVWDFTAMRLTIVDPLAREGNAELIRSKHFSRAAGLHAHLITCIDKRLPSHAKKTQAPLLWNFICLTNVAQEAESDNTALYSLYLALEFDGVQIRKPPTKDRLMDFRNSLAYHIVRIDGNTGYCPEKAMAIN